MKPNETHDIIQMMKAATSTPRLEQEQLEFWESQLTPLDADLATKAVVQGIKTWQRFPSWANFADAYQNQYKLSQPAGEQRSDLPEIRGKRGVAVPEWVYVWWWCRRSRTPRNLVPFPQQENHVDPTTVMSMQEYKKLREEWKAAGAPKVDVSREIVKHGLGGQQIIEHTLEVLREVAE